MKKIVLIFALLAALVAASTATATVEGGSPGPSVISFPNAAAAHARATGIPSFVFAPGTSTTFSYPTGDGNDVVTVASQRSRSFSALVTGWTTTWAHYTGGALHTFAWRWQHYTEFAYTGQCVTNKIANNQWSAGAGAAWEYRGAGSYYVWTINPPCTPLGILWSGNQGHYSYVYIFEHEYPWELGEAYGTGNYRIYDYGYSCNGLCS